MAKWVGPNELGQPDQFKVGSGVAWLCSQGWVKPITFWQARASYQLIPNG
ncbi:hypothetical protein TorRG33x02_135120 [Trema orientale]|uniref:Uncharacterized protein n=1 Tax=Trema orientale TaxID=63057 RepID=A0A2P5EYN9_TREOI|nr:hypothetical protein TorRG33x02_135120 [Trema orientale]